MTFQPLPTPFQPPSNPCSFQPPYPYALSHPLDAVLRMTNH
jgi:hypothetical protein